MAFGEKTFIVHEAERISFDAFGRAALALSWRLVEAGVRPGEAVTPEALQTHVRVRLAAYKTPVRILISETSLPRNPAGKLLKSELRPLFPPSVARTEPAPRTADRHD